jgi:hypothetical protein
MIKLQRGKRVGRSDDEAIVIPEPQSKLGHEFRPYLDRARGVNRNNWNRKRASVPERAGPPWHNWHIW